MYACEMTLGLAERLSDFGLDKQSILLTRCFVNNTFLDYHFHSDKLPLF